MAEALLSVRGVSAGYGPFQVLDGIDLDVFPGEIVAVLGANGVGKTTLNRVLSGLIRAPTSRARATTRSCWPG